jgi:hypothetical protein
VREIHFQGAIGERLNARFDGLQHRIMIGGGGLACSLIATLGGLFVSLN